MSDHRLDTLLDSISRFRSWTYWPRELVYRKLKESGVPFEQITIRQVLDAMEYAKTQILPTERFHK